MEVSLLVKLNIEPNAENISSLETDEKLDGEMRKACLDTVLNAIDFAYRNVGYMHDMSDTASVDFLSAELVKENHGTARVVWNGSNA